jgi:HAD superfamily hydrolase (TIGR01459 family)
MNGTPVLVSGLSAIAGGYDALICDVWGVLHDGVAAHPQAVEALLRFRQTRGRVVLLSNAPRPAAEIVTQLRLFGISDEVYDALVTSGGAARDELIRRIGSHALKLFHIGPERDETVFKGLAIEEVEAEAAEVVLCTGLYDDTVETPDDYADILAKLKAHDLTMICANPDILVPRAGQLVHCAGGVARAYEKIGGTVIYYGKPHKPIYAAAIEAAGKGARILVVGDALETDIAGANAMGLDALFVAHGLHKDEIGDLTPESLAALFARHGLKASAAVDVFKW